MVNRIMKKFGILMFLAVILAAWVVPGYSLDTAWDAQYRVRGISSDNARNFNDDNKVDRDSWIDQRFRLGIKLTEAPVSGYVQLQMGDTASTCSATSTGITITCLGDSITGPNDSHTWGSGGGENFDIQVRQAYLDFPVGPVGLRAGRTYASHGFLAGGMFENIADRIIVSYKASDELSGNFIHAKAREGSSAGVDTTGANDNDKNIYNLGATWKPAGRPYDAAARIYYVRDGLNYKSATSGADTSGGTWDAFWLTAQTNMAFNPIKVYLSAAFLTGSSEPAAAGSPSIDLAGLAIHGDVNVTQGPFKAGLVAGLGSGDDNTGDTKLDTFFAPSGASYIQSHIFWQNGENTYAPSILNTANLNTQNGSVETLSNVTWAGIYGDFKAIPDKLTLSAKIATFMKTEALANTDDSIGNEVDLTANYMIHKNLSLLAFAAYFLPDDGITGGGTATDDTVTEYYARLQWEF